MASADIQHGKWPTMLRVNFSFQEWLLRLHVWQHNTIMKGIYALVPASQAGDTGLVILAHWDSKVRSI
jgi:hypothetical protein